ncbi:hypothetical protein Vqi01_07310 [Micromonospora qiuiae]|uniref:Uncharacterized protein n=1 Tax=Micromonospora qiuiae TaxID=502268 RepID=A0ABQ4J5X7_9ACTN|nr:hypothetical protein [Micromonospora qiuiae]GIJ25569.1 hypothetical protein Vqi01_07310 [Micromonospora qiuiae]
MAYGEAEHGCAQGEPCRPGPHEQPAVAKHHRRLTGFTHPVEPAPGWLPERPEDDVLPAGSRAPEPGLPHPRAADSPAPEPEPTACRSQIPGWAGAHRHAPVRPAQRNVRRERPPRRWC